MRRLSDEIAKLENRWMKKIKRWRSRHLGSWKLYALLGVGHSGRPGHPALYGTTGSIPKPAPLFAAQPV